MATPINITPEAQTDGIAYATAVPLTTTEAVLGDVAEVPTVVPTSFNEAISATVVLAAGGIITGNSTYVVMQMDMGGGTWVDMCWCFWTGTQGSATFIFSNGIAGANTIQQTRGVGQVPINSTGVQGSGSNQLALGGRLRFVGKTVMTGGSSGAPGTPAQVTATIRYKLLSLR